MKRLHEGKAIRFQSILTDEITGAVKEKLLSNLVKSGERRSCI